MPGNDNKPSPTINIILIVLWILGIGIFLSGAGCSLFYFGLAFSGGRNDLNLLGSILMIVGLVVLVQALILAQKNRRVGKPIAKLLVYFLWLPLLAVFIWGGGCMLIFSDF